MNKGYFFAEPLANGAPGRPVGTSNSRGILMFDAFADVDQVRPEMLKKFPKVKIFEFNLSLVGEVVSA